MTVRPKAILSSLTRGSVYAGIGGWICSLVGTTLVSLSFTVVDWLFNNLPYSDLPPVVDDVAIGAFLGGTSGGIMGSTVLGFIGLIVRNVSSLLPSRVILSKMALSMGIATAIFVLAFIVQVEVVSRARDVNFFFRLLDDIFHDSHYLTYGLPAFMMCGQIVGAIWGCRVEKSIEQRPISWHIS